MYCINCGTPLPEKTRFCISCGAAQPDLTKLQQPVGQTPQPKSRKPLIVTLIIVAAILVLSVAAVFVVPIILDGRHSIEAAEKYMQQNKFDEAIAEYVALIDADSENYDAYIGLAEAYAEMARSGEEDLDDMMDEIEDLIKDVDDKDTEEELTEIMEELAEDMEKDISKEEVTTRPPETTPKEPEEAVPPQPQPLELATLAGSWCAEGYSLNESEYSEPINLTIHSDVIVLEGLDGIANVYADEMEFGPDTFSFICNGYRFNCEYNELIGIEATTINLSGETLYFRFTEGMVDLVPHEGSVLNIWCWNDEFRQRMTEFYPDYIDNGDGTGRIGDVIVNWTINTVIDNGYQVALDTALLNQNDTPADEKIDIFLIEADYADKYVESDYTLELSTIGITDADTAEMYPYTKQIVTDRYGVLKGAAWQACPGVFAYRRSIAREVLGTDDPAKVQEYVSDWVKFDETAARMKDAGYYMLSSCDDAFRAFSNNRFSPWVDDDFNIVIDEQLLRWVQQTKDYVDHGRNNHDWDNMGGLWSERWCYDQMADGKVFGYFYSTWGVNFTLPMNAGDAGYGDWAVCYGPDEYYWGGTWICAGSQTDNKTLVKDVIYQLCCNEETMYAMATDPDIRDYANNMAAMERAAESDYSDGFLGGQNPFAVFHEAAMNVDTSNSTLYDAILNDIFRAAFRDYFKGGISYERALELFYINAVTRFPELQYEN